MGAEGRDHKGDDKKPETVMKKWPIIKPKRNLQINSIKNTELFTVEEYLTSEESKAFVAAAEAIGFVHQTSVGPRQGEAYRDNDRISVNDPVLADAIWKSGLSNMFSDIKVQGKKAIGLNPNIRFYKYKAGQQFASHYDAMVNFGEGKCTHYTLLIYLSGGPKMDSAFSEPLVGGETVFYGARSDAVVAEVAPIEGMAVLHVHGNEYELHEARSVKKGIKYVLRSDVVFA